jgi:hypothetical protein
MSELLCNQKTRLSSRSHGLYQWCNVIQETNADFNCGGFAAY